MDIWLTRPVYPNLKIDDTATGAPNRINEIFQKDNKPAARLPSSSCAEFQAFRSKLRELLECWSKDKTLDAFRTQHNNIRKSFGEAVQLEKKFIQK